MTLVTLLIALGWLGAGRAGAEQRVTVRAVKDRSGVRLVAVNATAATVTARVELTSASNVSSTTRLPATFVVRPGETRELVRLGPASRSRAWRYTWHYNFVYGQPALHDARARYRWPFDTSTPRFCGQGNHGKFTHNGPEEYAFDFRMPIGTPVRAARGGVVALVEDRYSRGGKLEELKTQANEVLIAQDDGTIARYLHLQQHGVRVREGQHVATGDLLGLSGNVGYSTEPHLHFEVRTVVANAKPMSVPVQFQDGSVPVRGRWYPGGLTKGPHSW